ncbi:Pre-mRNA-splicing factor ISY1 [Phytophthora megakarya]|uniref:Pre-mRNA-splicing factor ISY1 n=1 Tax=Phytophthora megakarya TaxID=4795 RepID=A0A225UKG1_9STRA|nr:Pre-mRNA-splicing factor ISY1 [Phytophthora megakarya]
MARNEEKAQSLLNRWTSMKQDFADTFKNRRPYLASQCDNLRDAERWRRQLVREISKKVADIQNTGSSEHVIRDLNDDINKRIREKRHWERRIVQLGGSDHKSQPLAYDADGDAVMEVGGYKYFGAAKDLPGVRELFQKDEYEPRKRTRHDMDEEEAENKLRQQAMDAWDAAEAKRKAQVAELVRLQAAVVMECF